MIVKIIKLPFKAVAAVLAVALMALHFVGAIALGLSAIVTNLLASVFLFGSVAGWIMNQPPIMLMQTVGIGIFFALAPHIAEWLLGKLTDLTIVLLGFICS
ncbi:MAG: hypothetical protein GX173_09240 [Ruminococcaceae bacterium]|jgi:predicted alpha/beta hydrolase|nr:hypothetical protein [Oscillospiraceae bacterium]